MNEHRFTRQTMRRIYAVWIMRMLLRPALVRMYIFTVLSIQLLHSVSVVNVVSNTANSSSNMSSAVAYLAHAFVKTELLVQLILFALVVLVFFMTRHAMKMGKTLTTSASNMIRA